MNNLVFWEIKKMIKRPTIILSLGFIIWFSFITVTRFTINDSFSDVFYKSYGLMPIVGIFIYSYISGVYAIENRNNMKGIICSTKIGANGTVKAKISATAIIIWLFMMGSFLGALSSAISVWGTSGFSLQVNELWYFGKTTYTLTVGQLIMLTIAGITIGSILYSQVTNIIASSTKKSVLPFILGGLFMGLPYILEIILIRLNMHKLLGVTPLWNIFWAKMVRYNISPIYSIGSIILFIVLLIISEKICKNRFIKEI